MGETALDDLTPAVTGQFKDGIYLDLEENLYRFDSALGSTDVGKLRTNPANYWYESPFNPTRPTDNDTPAKLRGRAMHKLVLEGQKAFDALYLRGPEHTADMTPAEKGAMTKAANAEAAKTGKTVLPVEAYDRTMIASAMISLNPALAGAFTGGLPEVSIFWTRDGVRRKARIDYLKPRGVGDLKSIANTREIEFPAACRYAIANYRYEVQASHYLEARSKITEFFETGKVNCEAMWGTSSSGMPGWDILRKCAEAKEYAFQWIFFQAERAPVTWSAIVSPQNPILEIARREIDLATDNYKAFMDKFGPDQMWITTDEPQELAMEDMPQWAFRT